MNETGSSQHISAEAVPLLSCPLCGSSNLVEGVAYPHASSAKEPAMMCCDCTCRALKSDWQKRPAVPAMPATDAVREALETAEKELFNSYRSGRLNGDVTIRREFKKLRAALSHASQGGWQPISTAPKDGTRISLYQPGRGQFEGWWHDAWPRACEEYWMDYADSEPEPTHWQPLPAPPEVQP